jgi:hypothetical protein
MNNTSEKMWKKEVVACLQVLFQNFSGLSGENHEDLQSGIWSPDWNLTVRRPKYEAAVIMTRMRGSMDIEFEYVRYTVHGAMSRGVLYRSQRYVTRSIIQITALCHAEYYTDHVAMSRGVLYRSRRYVTRSVIQFTTLCHAEYYTDHGARSRAVL